MKRLNKTILTFLFSVIVLLTACDDFFTKDPVGKISINSYWTTEADVKSWMAGIYSGIQQTLGNTLVIWGEARSDNFYPTIYGGDKWQNNAILITESQCNWENLYAVIARCNGGLENVERVKSVSENNMKMYKGQLYAIRAFMYFYAIRVWGEVPLITQTWDGRQETKYNSRAAMADIKTQIEDDLKMALAILPEDVTPVAPTVAPNNANCFYFSRAAALALKMDVHMWFNEYPAVVETSEEVLKMTRYSLVNNSAEWRDIFLKPQDSKETIFTMNWVYPDNDQNPYGGQMSADDKNPMLCVSSEAFTLMLRSNKQDVRLWGVLDTLSIYNSANKAPISESSIVIGVQRGDKVCKFYEMTGSTYGFNKKGSSICDFKIPIYRYADVLLMRAEALNKSGGTEGAKEAIEIVNKIRRRCGNTVEASVDYYNIQNGYDEKSRERLILEERQVEFYGEGKRWFDLRRSGETFYTVMNAHSLALQSHYGFPELGFPKDGRELFPLYYKVFSANPMLVGHQNPGYSE